MMIKQFPAIKRGVVTGTLILAAILTSFASAASAQTLNAASNADFRAANSPPPLADP
jgi:hypothetical protein